MPVRTVDPPLGDDAFDLDVWRVEPQCNRISSGETSIRLEPKAMEVLVCLAEHAGEVVPRRVLVDQVWATEFITDSTLTHTIADLRRAFGDDPRQPRFIETIPKRGYRLVSEIEPVARAAPSDGPGVRTRPLAVIAGNRVRVDDAAATVPCECYLFVSEREIPLPVRSVTFGRDHRAEIQILAPEVSRLHARLELVDGHAVIEDLGSKNGTSVNDHTIAGRHDVISGDAIGVGPCSFVFRCLISEPTRTQGGA